MSTPPPPPLQLDLCTVLSESKRIINAHSRHFLALSVLFLLPLSFSLTVFPTLQLLLLSHSSTLNSKIFVSLPPDGDDQSSPLPSTTTLLLSLSFSLFFLLFSLLATASITYSVFHGFYGRPVKLLSAVKSALSRFFPLLLTVLFLQIISIGVVFLFGSLYFLVVEAVQLAGFRLEPDSLFVAALTGVVTFVVALSLLFLQLVWCLAPVVVVVEGSWGMQPLKRSYYLMGGMRRVALHLLLFFGFFTGVLLWASSGFGSLIDGWDWAVVVQIVVTSALLVLLFLYSVAAHAVLYMYCKAARGELAWEIAEEFAREYVSLPFDDGKVPHLVSVAYYP
ncbi:hypothetical protein Tsubulata_027720 [Turnera subulata]|uniref:Transmembrane protein n=1 Tax=Turnera subulata TaxID=218843 RepID=A0A9Q0J009_9ROSI|nr:hypothetical protein Tsubulata_027720 [Turnera subulata]